MATLKLLKLRSILTSADLGLEKDFLVGVRLEKGDPGEKVWIGESIRGCSSTKLPTTSTDQKQPCTDHQKPCRNQQISADHPKLAEVQKSKSHLSGMTGSWLVAKWQGQWWWRSGKHKLWKLGCFTRRQYDITWLATKAVERVKESWLGAREECDQRISGARVSASSWSWCAAGTKQVIESWTILFSEIMWKQDAKIFFTESFFKNSP